MKKLREIWSNKWVKFSIATLIYVLWFVVWTQNLWMLLGVAVIYDIYISKYMARAFWNKHKRLKKEKSAYRKTAEWIEAILFATVVASLIHIYIFQMFVIPSSSMEKSLLVGDYLCVSKVAYGPKMPNTPIAFPFVHHTMPFSTTRRSFSEIVQWPYHRLAGFGHVKQYDAVVFNFPEGDTVALNYPEASYYYLLRQYRLNYGTEGRAMLWKQSPVIHRPVDKREHYIKRAIGMPGDTILIRHSNVTINGTPQKEFPGIQHMYFVRTNGTPINPEVFRRMQISRDDIGFQNYNDYQVYTLPLTAENAESIKRLGNVTEVTRYEATAPNPDIFPQSPHFPWNEDNFGPLWIPREGATADLTMETLPLYHRIIETYEGNKLEVRDSVIYINGQAAENYTFKMDYYFMMGDNRHASADSRYWGFVPIDHIVGKASFIWLSLDKDESFPKNIRWSRIFTRPE